MDRFIGVKEINATPMNRGDYNALRGWVVPSGENPEDDGFLVEYVDGGTANHPDFSGYISWSPKDVFERAYRRTQGMTFGLAVEAMKQGCKVARSGWNGSGMFAYIVPEASYPAQTSVAKKHFGEGSLVPYRSYLALKTAQGDVATWAPSCSDALSEDWEVVQ